MGLVKSLLGEDEMLELLTVRRESATQDYRRDLPPKGYKACGFLDLLRDIVAMANIGGGVIVFGVEDENYDVVGISRERQHKRLDDADLLQGIRTYLDRDLSFELAFYEHKNKAFAFLAIMGVQRPLLFRKTAQCENCKENAAARHFFTGSSYIRLGSSTVRASEAWLTQKLSDLQLLESIAAEKSLLMHNLPSRNSIYDNFVGRTAPMEQAIKSLSDERRRITWIQGSGGIGKTAMSYRIAEMVVAGQQLKDAIDYVVWISAKDTALTLEGIERRQPTLTCVADIVRATLEVTAGIVEIKRMSPEHIKQITTAEQALELLHPILAELTGLLILDNLETIEDHEVFLFLQGLPGRTRSLATTRRKMEAIGGETVVLEPMGFGEADDLIKSEAIRTGRGWLTSDDSAVKIVIEMSGRIPLAIRLIVPRLESPRSLTHYQAALPKHGKDLLDFCYAQTYSDLSQVEQRLFFALSLFGEGASLAELGFIMEVDINDPAAHDRLLQQIEKLLHLSVATIRQPGVRQRYEMQSLVRRFASRRLKTDISLKHGLMRRFNLLDVRMADDLVVSASKAVELYNETGEYEESMAVLDACLKRDAKNAQVWLSKAEIEMRHGKNVQRTEVAAREVRNLAEKGSVSWRSATRILAELELQSGAGRRAIELLSEIDDDACDGDTSLLLAECYLQTGLGIRVEATSQDAAADDLNRAKANCTESVKYASKAARCARQRKQLKKEAKACVVWARAAAMFNLAVAYQAAGRALELGGLTGDVIRDMKEIQNNARTELRYVPREDLLNIESE